ncbi:Uncharacterized membrane protein YebE, DUF533 family [Loktanella sp. DSM 29012]|uniref:DUF533 domain-containing protein n=1 Tax=Loktanella sp. DSM 29012 TaxID=1881056 RepID=UPI0008D4EB44|nr:DUF533 domain-containing protein [Loktanella sp. DSM 29012]SEP92354.1 Uncharacterized membrane protein YebE, DUF533 family [Loktanella sp. DSM 29012]
MSLMKTLARVAVGVAVAKGAASLTRSAKQGKSGTMLDDMLGGGSRSAGGSTGSGGLGGLLESLQGAKTGTRSAGSSGGLAGMLGGLTGGGSSGGALGGLAGAGGLGGLLGGLAGASSNGGGGFGRTLNSQFQQTPEDPIEPTAEQEGLAAVMLVAMVQAAKADGQMDETERHRIMEHLDDATAEERAFVEQAMAADISVAQLAEMVPVGAEAQVYAMALAAIDLDHIKEAEFLRDFADQLQLETETVNDIHRQTGAPVLFG